MNPLGFPPDSNESQDGIQARRRPGHLPSKQFLSYGHCIGRCASFYAMSKGVPMGEGKAEVLQGTLDLMVLKTLYAMGPQHGFGIARRIEQVSDGVLDLNEGTVYTALLRLQQQGWIASKWGTSENNRRARFYSITRQAPNSWSAKRRIGSASPASWTGC